MNYNRQLEKVIEFIGQHLDEKLDLIQLSDIACFSKYHFHRLFTVYKGLSLHQYIRWLRLKRAAHQLVVNKDKTIIEIAINAGFESHESFTRAFKQVCGMNPSKFRLHSNWTIWEKPPYCLPKQGNIMNVEIKNISDLLTDFVRYLHLRKGLSIGVRKTPRFINSDKFLYTLITFKKFAIVVQLTPRYNTS